MKVMTILGTRPEIIRLSATLKLLDAVTEHVLVHTGQNYDYELSEVFFSDLCLRAPDHYLNCAKGTVGNTVGSVISSSYELMLEQRPDALLVLGDTNSCLAAYSAKRLHIPIFHMEAGNRCFDLRVPEETNRKLIDHIADVNLPYSNIAREHLVREGLDSQKIVVTGSPMLEVINSVRERMDSSVILDHLKLAVGQYFLLSVHREENIDSEHQLGLFLDLLAGLDQNYGLPILISTHPRTLKRIEEKRKNGLRFPSKVVFHKPFGLVDYLHLQKNARATLSDSGTITEEADILGFTAVNLRSAHERPEGMEKGVVPFLGFNIELICKYLDAVNDGHFSLVNEGRPIVNDYSEVRVSEIVVKSIISYVSLINRTTYYK